MKVMKDDIFVALGNMEKAYYDKSEYKVTV